MRAESQRMQLVRQSKWDECGFQFHAICDFQLSRLSLSPILLSFSKNLSHRCTSICIVSNYFSANSGLGSASFLSGRTQLTIAAHELLHSFSMLDSFTDDKEYCNTDWAAVGMFGDHWDIMSAMDVRKTTSAMGVQAVPGLNAHNPDRLGWSRQS